MTTEDYIALINREPTPEMIEQGEGYRYIKKTVLKRELLKIYGGHTKFEVTREVVAKNGLWGTGLFHYRHPVSMEWLFEAGSASIPITKGMKLDFPALKTAIFKNSVKEIGVWFGLELNSDVDDAEPVGDIPVPPEVQDEQTIEADFKKLMEAIEAFEYREDAQSFLETTSFKYYMPAKKAISLKPSKK